MLQEKTIQSEQGLRKLIDRNLRKEILPGTKPSVDFIKKVLDDAYESGMTYDVSDLYHKVFVFAHNSSNQAEQALKTVMQMKWTSSDVEQATKEAAQVGEPEAETKDDRLVFFDVEVYPNLFVICWKFAGTDEVVKMVNPKPHEVEELFRLKLVGFYNRRYDNHILYAAAMGDSPEKLFKRSSQIVEGNRGATFGAAYNLSFADIWDFSSVKQSLKKFELDLGVLHMELDIPWDQPVDESKWDQVVNYCVNDVRATEKVFEDRKQDYVARQILAELSGLTINDTTQNHTARIIFGNDKKAHEKFIYTDLRDDFPGYEFKLGKSYYKGEEPGEGGYVYAEPGMYKNVAILDVASMHPTSIVKLNLFGPYTSKFEDLIKARIAIKRKDFEAASQMLDGKLTPFLTVPHEGWDIHGAEQLAYALKIVINIVYGLTSAKFNNPFRDIRNVDNIVAKRGALFMIDLKQALQEKGEQVVHIKTDSIKIPGASRDIIEYVMEFGREYGYEFEHEGTYDSFCLVNDAVYVAGIQTLPFDEKENESHPYPGWRWSATGAQFQHPYVFKSLFSNEELEFKDFCEGRSVVKGAMYLDMTEQVNGLEPDIRKMRHVGKTGLFVPVLKGGGKLYRYNDEKFYAVSGTKGHLWVEAEIAKEMDDLEIDMSYFDKLKDTAVETIEKFGSFEELIS